MPFCFKKVAHRVRMLNFVKCFFCSYWDVSMGFVLQFIDIHILVIMICISWIIRNTQNLFHLARVDDLLMYCWVWFVNISLRIFTFVFIRDVDLSIYLSTYILFSVVSLSDFRTKILAFVAWFRKGSVHFNFE